MKIKAYHTLRPRAKALGSIEGMIQGMQRACSAWGMTANPTSFLLPSNASTTAPAATAATSCPYLHGNLNKSTKLQTHCAVGGNCPR